MRHDIVPPVGNRRGKVAYLQRGGKDFSLADGDGDDRVAVPCALVELVLYLTVGDVAALFARQINTELIAEAH